MSTRGMIAKPLGDGVQGVYQHWDSYPSGLGKTIWQSLHGGVPVDRHGIDPTRNKHVGMSFKDTEELLEFALDFEHGGWSSFPDCCYHHWRPEEAPILENLMEAPHCGGPDGCKEEECNPLFIAWVYVLSGDTMTVLGHYSIPDATKPFGSRYSHRVVACVDLRGEEPDWGAMQDYHSAFREGITVEEYQKAYL